MSAAGTLVTGQPSYPDKAVHLGFPAGSFAIKAAQRRVKAAAWLKSASSASRTRRAASARPVCISTSASVTAWWAHAGQQQWRSGGAGRPADARTHVDFIDFSPGALVQLSTCGPDGLIPWPSWIAARPRKAPAGSRSILTPPLAASSDTQARSPAALGSSRTGSLLRRGATGACAHRGSEGPSVKLD